MGVTNDRIHDCRNGRDGGCKREVAGRLERILYGGAIFAPRQISLG